MARHSNHFKKVGKIYYLTDWAGLLIDAMEEVSLVFHISSKGDVLLKKYGMPNVIKNWYEGYAKDDPNAESGSSTIVVTGTFEVEDLNKLISDESFAKEFHDDLFSSKEPNV